MKLIPETELLALVEKWHEESQDMLHKPSVLARIECREHADELTALIAKSEGVVVTDGKPIAWVYRYRSGDYSTRIFFIQPDQDEIDVHRDHGVNIVPLYLASEIQA